MDKKYKILAIDDEPINLKLLKTALSDYDVTPVGSATGALEFLETQEPDLILSDIMMPEMDGFEFCSKLKENPKWKNIPIIFVSALDGSKNISSGLNIGAVDYITKPIDIRILKARVEAQIKIVETVKSQIKDAELDLIGAIITTYNHEINNPLAIASGYLSLLDPEDSATKERVKKINLAHQRIADVLDSIKNIRRVTFEKYTSDDKMLKIKLGVF